MSDQGWFIHLEGEILGPLPLAVVQVMLNQNRIRFPDYIWTTGFTKWTRISDVDEFAGLLPPYPKVPIPSRATNTAQKKVETPTSTATLAGPEPEAAPVAAAPVVTPSAPVASAANKIRKLDRVKIQATMDIASYGKFDVENISERGALVRGKEKPQVGTEIKFKLQSDNLGSKALEMTGTVMRHSSTPENVEGFAVEFIRVNPAHKRILQEYVKTQIANQGQ